jgi:hypothetical protein
MIRQSCKTITPEYEALRWDMKAEDRPLTRIDKGSFLGKGRGLLMSHTDLLLSTISFILDQTG